MKASFDRDFRDKFLIRGRSILLMKQEDTSGACQLQAHGREEEMSSLAAFMIHVTGGDKTPQEAFDLVYKGKPEANNNIHDE